MCILFDLNTDRAKELVDLYITQSGIDFTRWHPRATDYLMIGPFETNDVGRVEQLIKEYPHLCRVSFS